MMFLFFSFLSIIYSTDDFPWGNDKCEKYKPEHTLKSGDSFLQPTVRHLRHDSCYLDFHFVNYPEPNWPLCGSCDALNNSSRSPNSSVPFVHRDGYFIWRPLDTDPVIFNFSRPSVMLDGYFFEDIVVEFIGLLDCVESAPANLTFLLEDTPVAYLPVRPHGGDEFERLCSNLTCPNCMHEYPTAVLESRRMRRHHGATYNEYETAPGLNWFRFQVFVPPEARVFFLASGLRVRFRFGSEQQPINAAGNTLWVIFFLVMSVICCACAVNLMVLVAALQGRTSVFSLLQRVWGQRPQDPAHRARRFGHADDEIANLLGSGGFGGDSQDMSTQEMQDLERADDGAAKMLLSSLAMEEKWYIHPSSIALGASIGRGGGGVVFEGEWKGVKVAVKRLPTAMLEDEVAVAELESEIRLLSRLRHPNVLQFFGATEFATHEIGLVTELCSGGSLFDAIEKKDTKFSWSLVLFVLRAMAGGLYYLHSCDPPIIHRDLKSPNVLISDPGFIPKIADFGLSRTVENEQARTMTLGVGSVLWMAPEIMLNQQYSPAVDIYSFGILTWEVVTRERPYSNINYFEIYEHVRSGGRPQVTDMMPKSLVEFIQRCWHENPEARPKASELTKLIDALPFDEFDPADRW